MILKQLNLLLISFYFLSAGVSAQMVQHKWVSAMIPQPGLSKAVVSDQKVDNQGNIITIGIFYGTVDFDPGPAVVLDSTPSILNWNVFIQKLDPSGNLIWNRSFGDSKILREPALGLDSDDNIYVASNFRGLVDFDPTSGVDQVDVSKVSFFLLKLDDSGSYDWVRVFEGDQYSSSQNFWDMDLDQNNNVYLVGNFIGVTDFDPGTGTATRTSANSGGQSSSIIVKMTEDGDYVWAHKFGDSFSYDINYPTIRQSIECVYTGENGALYVAGQFKGTIDFDVSSTGTHNETASGLNSDLFVLKLDQSGSFQWINTYLSDGGSDIVREMDGDSNGNIYVVGEFDGTMDLGPGSTTDNYISNGNIDNFIQKLSGSGNVLWTHSYGSGSTDAVTSISCNMPGMLHITGGFGGSCDFDPGTGVATSSSNGSFDVYMLSLTDQGSFLGNSSIGGAYSETGIVVTATNQGDIFVSGNFVDTVDFDPSALVDSEYSSTGAGFVWKLKMPGVGITETAAQLSDITMYPNPINNSFVELKFENPQDYDFYEIIDLNGRVCQTGSFSNSYRQRIELNTHNGTYFIRCVGSSHSIIRKVVILG